MRRGAEGIVRAGEDAGGEVPEAIMEEGGRRAIGEMLEGAAPEGVVGIGRGAVQRVVVGDGVAGGVEVPCLEGAVGPFPGDGVPGGIG